MKNDRRIPRESLSFFIYSAGRCRVCVMYFINSSPCHVIPPVAFPMPIRAEPLLTGWHLRSRATAVEHSLFHLLGAIKIQPNQSECRRTKKF